MPAKKKAAKKKAAKKPAKRKAYVPKYSRGKDPTPPVQPYPDGGEQ